MHQKCQKVASLVEGFSITFRLWTPLQFLFLDTLCGFSDMLLTVSRSPSTTHFLSFCHLLLGHSLDIFLSSICMSHVCTQIYIIYILNIPRNKILMYPPGMCASTAAAYHCSIWILLHST